MTAWSYETAFKRNLGLISAQEQNELRGKRVAIVGQGGVGGVHLVTLARLGVGRFTIADPDTFEVANFNRQYGAMVSTLGQNKADVMARVAADINPTCEIRSFKDPIGAHNIDQFLDGADLFIDGIDVFELKVRRMLCNRAAQKKIPAITAGPIGFSTAWLVFDPNGMSFDQYFDMHDGMDDIDMFVSFLVGLVPKATHRSYMDMSVVSFKARTAPSASIGCQLAAGVAGAEAVKLLLKRGPMTPAPVYHQFDAYKGKLVSGRLWGGNRNPLQRLKRAVLTRALRASLAR